MASQTARSGNTTTAAAATTTTTTTTTPSSTRMSIQKKCDVCSYSDGHKEMIMIQCTECQLSVHRDCYGMPTYTKTEFICWACQAVGKTFWVHEDSDQQQQQQQPQDDEDDDDDDDGDGNNHIISRRRRRRRRRRHYHRLQITQETRPTQCALCNIGDGAPSMNTTTNGGVQVPHAMHPLYDNYGQRARQLYRKNETTGKYRLVWVHTLCGFFLGTQGLMYGCTREGMTHEQEESDAEDDRSINPWLKDEDDQVSNDDNDDDNDNDDDDNDDNVDNQNATPTTTTTTTPKDLFGGFAPTHHFVYHVANRKGIQAAPIRNQWTEKVKNHQKGYKCCFCNKADDGGDDDDDDDDDDESTEDILRIAVKCSANDNDEYRGFKGTHNKSLAANETCTNGMHVGCARWWSRAEESNGNSERKLSRVFYFPGLPGENKLDPIRSLYCTMHAKDVNKKEKKIREAEEEAKHQEAKASRAKAMAQQGRTSTLAPDATVHRAKRLLPKPGKASQTASTHHRSTDTGGGDGDGDGDGKLSKRKRPQTNDDEEVVAPLKKMKRDLAQKVVGIKKDQARAFIKEQKILWQRKLLDLEQDEFQSMWKEVKNHANDVWNRHQRKG